MKKSMLQTVSHSTEAMPRFLGVGGLEKRNLIQESLQLPLTVDHDPRNMFSITVFLDTFKQSFNDPWAIGTGFSNFVA